MTDSASLANRLIPFNTASATLDSVGGKAINLITLVHAGIAVPNGFVIPTTAYREFVARQNLAQVIDNTLQDSTASTPAGISAASTALRAQFEKGAISPGLATALMDAWRRLGSGPVAVRSSATAEDLPGISFAGQQDTFLNVVTFDALAKAVVSCWSSLWTARAIGYRNRNGISQQDVALAVIVQNMVQSEASGVLFTANPLTGFRRETVIDATLGLGEALVSGSVEPDHYVVDMRTQSITQRFLGSKSMVTSARSAGGVHVQQIDAANRQAIPDTVIIELADISKNIERLFGFPQDIEWAWANKELTILQSRPITSLFPLPEGVNDESLQLFFSFASVQGLFDPITPIGRDAIREIFAAGARLFGFRHSRDTQTVIYASGERLWVRFTPLMRNSIGRRIVPPVFANIAPAVREAIDTLWDDPRLQPQRRGISLPSAWRVARVLLPLLANVVLNMLMPERRRAFITQNGEDMLQLLETRSSAIRGNRWQKLDKQLDLLPDFLTAQFPRTFRLYVSAVVAGVASWMLLNRLARGAFSGARDASASEMHDLVLQMTRGMPNNPTTEMDLALWEISTVIRRDSLARQLFAENTAAALSRRYLAGDLPSDIIREVRAFLGRYGARGLGEIDLGRTRWADDPTYIFTIVANYLQIETEERAPDVIFSQGAEAAAHAVTQLEAAVRKTRLGWVKARLVRFLAGRARQLMGMRESPKFFAVRMLWLIQRELLKTGRSFMEHGELDSPDDLLYLSIAELKAFAAHDQRDWRATVAARRQSQQRERLRKQIPRLLLSDGRAFYEGVSGVGGAGAALTGSPVSPGTVEGRVRIVVDPLQSGLQPGEILVCAGTDPSWTPLFLSAGGLIMEVGGMMTHGAVVAREYGIPAIVGVHQATTRLHTGQRVSMNGSSGRIILLDNEPVEGVP